MNTAVIEMPAPRTLVADAGRMGVTEVLAHVTAVQQVMRAVMKEDVHYGRIPGTDKPTLYKQGAEVLCLAFKIGPRYIVEDLSTGETARFRVTCEGIHTPSGTVMGQGLGECSGAEEKYRWRKAVCSEEFEAVPEVQRRMKYGRKSGGGFYTVNQIRVDAADVANTILKMAKKRAFIDMVLAVTAASDMFAQDLEDLDAALREHLTEDEQIAAAQVTRDEWIAKATAAASVDELTKVMKTGVKVFQEARDRDGHRAFASAVQARGAVLRQKQGAAHA